MLLLIIEFFLGVILVFAIGYAIGYALKLNRKDIINSKNYKSKESKVSKESKEPELTEKWKE